MIKEDNRPNVECARFVKTNFVLKKLLPWFGWKLLWGLEGMMPRIRHGHALNFLHNQAPSTVRTRFEIKPCFGENIKLIINTIPVAKAMDPDIDVSIQAAT